MSGDWRDVRGHRGWQAREKEDNRDIFDKALDAAKGAVVGGAATYGASRLGSRAARSLALKMGKAVKRSEYLKHARKTASTAGAVGAATGSYISINPRTEWRRKE